MNKKSIKGSRPKLEVLKSSLRRLTPSDLEKANGAGCIIKCDTGCSHSGNIDH